MTEKYGYELVRVRNDSNCEKSLFCDNNVSPDTRGLEKKTSMAGNDVHIPFVTEGRCLFLSLKKVTLFRYVAC